MSKSSLSSVVSGLVRASMGSSVSNTVTDEDLDRHVAELILREAKQKAERYGKEGYKAYLPSGSLDGNAPRTNKRFLTSIIRSTDDHNKTILRAQALAAQEIKREREEQERRDRRARAEEAVAAERFRRAAEGSHQSDINGWERGKLKERRRKDRSWDKDSRDDGYDDHSERDLRTKADKRKRSPHRSVSGERHSKREDEGRSRRSRTHEEDTPSSSKRRRDNTWKRTATTSRERPYESDAHGRRNSRRDRSRERHRRRHSSRSRSPRQRPQSTGDEPRVRSRDERSHSHSHERDPGPSVDPNNKTVMSSLSSRKTHSPTPPGKDSYDREIELLRKLKGKYKVQDDDEDDTSTSYRRSVTPTVNPSPTPSLKSRPPTVNQASPNATPYTAPSPDHYPSSSPLLSQPPSKMDKYFKETYDPRLDIAPLTAPKVPATGLINNAEFEGWDAMLELIRVRREDKEEKKRMERLGLVKDNAKDKKSKTGEGSVSHRWGSETVSIMDIEYKKRGSVREWDLGKDGF